MFRSSGNWVLWGFVALTIPGCSPSAPYYDLVAKATFATVKAETRAIAFGTQEARPYLVSGFSPNKVDEKLNLPMVVSTGDRAAIRFELLAPRDLEMLLTSRIRGGSPGSTLSTRVISNGSEVITLPLGRQRREQRIHIPAAFTRQGENRLLFESAQSTRSSPDYVAPRIAWYRIDFGAEGSPVLNAEANAASETLSIRAGSLVEYSFYAKEASRLRIDKVAPADSETWLEILLETDEGGTVALATIDHAIQGLDLALPVTARTPIRLTLHVRSLRGRASGKVVLTKPEVWAPQLVSTDGRDPVVAAQSGNRPNIVLYLIDTLRRDRLGCYGYTRPTSPNIDNFSEGATLYTNAIGQSTWTKASVASIFTGAWPPAHGATGWGHRLTDPTLAEALQAAGYRTAGIITTPNLVPKFGFDRGFDEYVVRLKVTAAEVNRLALDWLEENAKAGPFFLYLHTMEPHAGYSPPEPYRSQFEPRADEMPSWSPRWKWPSELLPFFSNLYDGEIAANDAEFGELLDRLRELDLYGDSMVILTSDHGEEFREHGQWRHGANLHSETLNIPLIVKYPDQVEGQRYERPVQHIDLLPTILGYLGIAPAAPMEGSPLRDLGQNGLSTEAHPSAPIFSHLRLSRSPLLTSIVDGEWKFIRGERQGVAVSRRLYNWRSDPGETIDLKESYPVRTALLNALIQEKWSTVDEAEPADTAILDEQMQQDLRALGYLQ